MILILLSIYLSKITLKYVENFEITAYITRDLNKFLKHHVCVIVTVKLED